MGYHLIPQPYYFVPVSGRHPSAGRSRMEWGYVGRHPGPDAARFSALSVASAAGMTRLEAGEPTTAEGLLGEGGDEMMENLLAQAAGVDPTTN